MTQGGDKGTGSLSQKLMREELTMDHNLTSQNKQFNSNTNETNYCSDLVQSLKIVHSSSTDPWFNLALEETLLNELKPEEIILYLWQNNHTVVIGRNQNTWKECDWEQLEKDGGKLARRLSGGGAVYHDLGNLNFTFILSKKNYDLDKQLLVIIEALKILNINAQFSGRNDLLLEGKKFSGHAYYFREQAALHHGTILVHSKLENLNTYLKPSAQKIKSKGIESVRSRVINLTEINSNLTIPAVIASLEKSFTQVYNGTPSFITYQESDQTTLSALYGKYSSWEWRYGESPAFDLSFGIRFTWGEVEFGFRLKNGIITHSTLYSDAMDENLIRTVADSLIGLPLKKQQLIASLNLLKNTENAAQIDDLSDYLSQELLT